MMKVRMFGYIVLGLSGVVLNWLTAINGVLMVGLIILSGLLLYLERCPICSKPYLLQRGKSLFHLGGKCENCGTPIS